MKTLKKIISLSVVMTMILTTLLTNCAFAAIEFNDVNETTAYSQAIQNLVEDGVLNGYDNEDGSKSFKPEADITRAEFAKVIVVAKFGTNVLADATKSKFKDMEGHWSIPYVEYASGSGIINGYEDGSFQPEKSVSYAEAVKMIVCALGYGSVVETTNPWYQGYLNIANSIGLTKGAVGLAELPAVRGLVAQLIDNMGECNTLVQNAIGPNGEIIHTQGGGGANADKILGPDIYEGNGALIGIYDNTLIGNDTRLNMGRVNIDEKIFELEPSIDYLTLKDLVGQAVTFNYYTKGATSYISSIKSANRTDIYTIDAPLIESFDGSRLYYYQNEASYDTKHFTFDQNLYVVYNGYGVEKTSINVSNLTTWLTMDTGSVTLYNNDTDSEIDVAFIDKFETFYALAPVTIKGQTTIKDKFDQTRTFTANEDDVIVTKITSEGGAELTSKLSSFSAGNVISVARPLSSNAKAMVKISSATASGNITEIGSNYENVKMGSKEYKFTKYFRDLEATDPAKYGFVMGSNVKFYLDYTGKVVFAEVTVSDIPYGYLIDYAVNSGIDSDVITVRFIDKSGKLATYNLKSKVKINGNVEDADVAITQLAASSARIHANKAAGYDAFPPRNAMNSPVSQVIKYKLGTENGNTVVEELFTVSPANAASQDAETGGIVPVWTTAEGAAKAPFLSCNTSSKLTCSGSAKQFKDANGNTQFAVGSKTIVFRVPGGIDSSTGQPVVKDPEKYKRSTGGSSFSDKVKYYVEAYDLEDTTAQVVVYYLQSSAGGTQIYANTSTYMVVNIATVSNNGKTVHELEYVKLGENIFDPADGTTKVTKKVYAEDTTQIADLKKGDVIKFVTSSGEIEKVEKIFIFENKELYSRLYTDDTSRPDRDANGDGAGDGDGVADNYFAHKKGNEDEYYQARYGKVYSMDIEDEATGKGSIAIYTDGSQDNYDQIYSLTADTKYYTQDDRGNVVDAGYGAITEGTKSDYASASNVLVVSYDDKVVGVYVMPQQ